MNYIISTQAVLRITSFYNNVAKKYRHTYDYSLMHRNIDETMNSIYRIENRYFKIKTNIKQMEQVLYG